MPDIQITEIEHLSYRALVAHGAAPGIAAEMARAIAWAEARGNRICGLYYLESYCLQLRSGRVRGTDVAVVSQPRPAEIIVDAGYGFAQPAFRKALPQAIKSARENGLCQMAIHKAHTCTALGYFTQAAAEKGLIALGMTNASPIVAPPGGKTRLLGTNPIAFAVPDGQGGLAMMFDQSTTTVALGRITMALAAGETIPEGWALDADGRPTTDPAKALQGSLVSMGGHTNGYKGWGIGVMVEVLVSCLAGSLPSREVQPLKAPEGPPHQLGQFFVLLDPAAGVFHDRVAALAEAVQSDPGCRLPGQNKDVAEYASVPGTVWRQLQDLAAA